jgi:outer membrane receptor protein involved in Fe transport
MTGEKNMSNTLLREAIRHGLRTYGIAGATLASGFVTLPALAQDAAADQNSQKLETITVTGSNIRRVDIETSNPVVTIDRAAIEKTGKLTLGDLVQQLPSVTGPNMNPQINNGGGTGGSSIGLRGLGSTRTLILINGHRFLSGDPNAIPANMVERIEVLTDGASSVYGSDAIAGVVNFILRSDYQGAEFSTDYGISDHDDGVSRGYQFTFGQSSDKGSIMAGISYKKIDGVLSSHRDFSKDAISLYGTNGGPPGGNPVHRTGGGSTSSQFGHFQVPAALRPQFGCSFLTHIPGTTGQSLADYRCYRNNDGPDGPTDKYNFATVNLIMTPQERTGLFLNGNYKLTDNVEAYLSVLHNKTAAAFQLAPAIYSTNPGGAIVSKDSYYNPFGVEFSKNATSFNQRLVVTGNRAAASGRNDDQVSTGFKGTFNVWNEQQWNWDLGFDYGHQSVSTLTSGLPNVNTLNKGTGPSFLDTDGVVRCGTPGHAIDSCVPFNPFNLQDPNTIEQLRRAASPGVSNAYTIETIKRLDLNGPLFELPGGSVQLAVGANYRTEYTHSNADTSLIINPDTGICILGSQCASSLQGGFNVKEAYAELFVPILKDLPFIHALNVTIGDRYSKFSTFGSTNNAKLAVEWRPIEDLLLRGTASKVFRAPQVGNVFGGATSDAPKLSSDPCDHYTGSPVNPACVNVPTDGSFVNQNIAQQVQANGIISGSAFANFPLGPELGKSFDFGVVYDPHWLEGLSVSADVWRLFLSNNITSVRAQSVLNLCSSGTLSYCPLIRRFASGPNVGQIDNIIEPTGNLGRVDVAGADFALTYRLPEFSFGKFHASLNATYTKNYDINTAPGTAGNSTYHYAGHFLTFGSSQAAACPPPAGGSGSCLFPRWRAQTELGWNLGPFDASWSMRYIGRFRMGSPAPSQDVFPAGQCYYGSFCSVHGLYFDHGATVYHDIQFGYNIEAINTRIDVGVLNVGDKQPPFLYANNTLNANTDPSDFDLMGRYYFGRVTVKF